MPRTEEQKPLTADEIAAMADRGESVARSFTNAGRMMLPIQRANVDSTPPKQEGRDGQED